MSNEEFKKRIKTIVEERLIRVTPEIKEILPTIFREKIDFFTVLTDTHMVLDFIDEAEKERIQKLIEKNIHPFPYLIKPEETAGGCAFRFEKTKYALIEDCTVENMFSFSLGKDSTIILRNHTQIVNTRELGIYKYLIQLAYIISFGDEINRHNFYGALEDLIAYSLKTWRPKP